MSILIPILAVAVIGLICGVGLSVASVVMKVEEDERLPAIRACLPGANCGACGYSGCDAYAKALLEPGAKTNLCVPGGEAAVRQLSAVLGVEAAAAAPRVAVVHCSGSCEKTQPTCEYHGISSCTAAKLFYGGGGNCVYGCLGHGDCAKVCPQNAIGFAKGIAVVDSEKCVGCGLCAKACPQMLIGIVPADTKVDVLCSNKDKGASTKKACSIGCIGCKKCEKTCRHGAITVADNVARIDYEKCTGCGECVEVCMTGCLTFRGFLNTK
ncbi:MAG: RnfABCDGE type electron transport complex subunit B [Clostridia bacterium]|nr:RnfABCDGE type electron transport complex subunit B [Clostridia bacterium]